MSDHQKPDREPVHTFEWTNPDGPSGPLLRALPEVVDEELTELEPLYSVVNPDSLDSLFGPTGSTPGRINGSVQFEYAGHHIVVRASGKGYIYERDGNYQPPTNQFVGGTADAD